MPIFGAAYAAPNIGTTILYCFRSLSTALSSAENSRIQVLFKAFSVIFQYFSRQIYFSRNFQESRLNRSTFQALANPVNWPTSMRGSRNFRQGGGGPGQSDKKSSDSFFFFFFFF